MTREPIPELNNNPFNFPVVRYSMLTAIMALQNLTVNDLIPFMKGYLSSSTPNHSRGQALLRLLFLDRDLRARVSFHRLQEKLGFYNDLFLSLIRIPGYGLDITEREVLSGLEFDSLPAAYPYFFGWRQNEFETKIASLHQSMDERQAVWGENFALTTIVTIAR
jgi:hypothetical protein